MSLSCTVVSFFPQDIKESKPGLVPPSFFIPASDMKTPSLLKVGTCSHFVYMDESRGSLMVKDPSDIVAKSIVEDFCSSQLGIAEDASPGLFWIDEDLEWKDIEVKYK